MTTGFDVGGGFIRACRLATLRLAMSDGAPGRDGLAKLPPSDALWLTGAAEELVWIENPAES